MTGSETQEAPTPIEPSATRLEVSGLSAGYLGIPAVREIDLRLAPGEVVALLGSNGAGKTTTLAAIAGLIRPLAGTVELEGDDITGGAAFRLARRGIALVPEDRALFHDLTTRENLRLGRPARRGGRKNRDADVLELLPELHKCLERKAGALSGGEQQMLAVGRALMSGPKVLLVDEMSMGLAPVVVERLSPVLSRIAATAGTAVLVVEQHVGLALELASRAYVMAHGRIVLEGASSVLRSRRDLLMACYLGDLEAASRLSDLQDPSSSTSADAERARPDTARPENTPRR